MLFSDSDFAEFLHRYILLKSMSNLLEDDELPQVQTNSNQVDAPRHPLEMLSWSIEHTIHQSGT